MPEIYNTTNLTNAISPVAKATELNILSDGVFGGLIILTIIVIIYLTASRGGNTFKMSMTGATFGGFAVGLVLFISGVFADGWFVIVMIAAGGMALVTMMIPE